MTLVLSPVKHPTSMKRGTIKKRTSTLVAVWVPLPLASAVDSAIELQDSDRSKFLRNAIREKLARMRIRVPVLEVAR